MRVAVHLGAHKTATTYIQSALEASQGVLGPLGIAYVPLDEMRAKITPLVRRPGLNLRRALQQLIDTRRGCRRLILSDENLSGLCGNAVRAGTYYARIDRRVARLVRAAGRGEVELLFATRSYDAFVSSMYCEHLRHRPFLALPEYLAAVDVEGFSWRRIVETLCGLVGQERVTIWRYEDFPQIEDRIFAALCGGEAPVRKPGGRVRESLSQKAIDALGALSSVLDRGEIRALVPAIAAALPKTADDPAFAAFEADRAAAMGERYARDMAAIARDFPQITLLAPPREAPASAPPAAAPERRPSPSLLARLMGHDRR